MQGNQIQEKPFQLLRSETQSNQTHTHAKKKKIEISKVNKLTTTRLKLLHRKKVFLSSKSDLQIIFNK